MTFSRKKIDLVFELGTGVFGDTGSSRVALSNHRVSAQIIKAGGATMGECQLRVYGLSMSLMNQLSALAAYEMVQRRNTVRVLAGEGDARSVVFEGTIAEGWVDMNAAPDVCLEVISYAGLFEKIKPAAPSTYPGSADAATIMSNLATAMGLGFENNGVSVMLATPYFPGTAWEQTRSCAEAAGINWTIDKGVLSIWNEPGARKKVQVPTVSPATGMVGYPSYTGTGIGVKTTFRSDIEIGGLVAVESSLPQACGTWYVTDVSYDLECEMPGGAWHTQFVGRVPYQGQAQ